MQSAQLCGYLVWNPWSSLDYAFFFLILKPYGH